MSEEREDLQTQKGSGDTTSKAAKGGCARYNAAMMITIPHDDFLRLQLAHPANDQLKYY